MPDAGATPVIGTQVPAGWGDKVLASAEKFLGIPYVLGGDGYETTDCGQFTLLAFRGVGVDLDKRCADDQAEVCADRRTFFKDKSNAIKGDLVFFRDTYGSWPPGTITHVGIWVGPDKFIHAGSSTGVAYSESEWLLERIAGFGRVVPDGFTAIVPDATRPGGGTSTTTSTRPAKADPKTSTTAAVRATTPIPNEEGYVIRSRVHGNHINIGVKKKPLSGYNEARKTYAEPVYPDLVTVTGEIPQWLLAELKIKDADLELRENMNFQISFDKLEKVYGVNIAEFLGSSKEIQERQIVFNPKDYLKKTKAPTTGKPPNNNDPYPVDSKANELELHQPRVKIEEIDMCQPSGVDIQLAQEIIGVSDRAEKRVVKLENLLSTLMRYFWRTAARVPVNCVYYGGQSIYQKYKCIRCTHDDRIRDGQLMSLDQCLACTRYEPIIGQVYDILNEKGVSLKAVQDNNQMSFMDMQDYVELARVEEFHDPRKAAKIDMSLVQSRAATEKDFKDIWPAGAKMNWSLVPVEEQKSGINPRQDIAGSHSSPLGTHPNNNSPKGGTIPTNGSMAALMKMNYENIIASGSPYAVAASSISGRVDAFLSNMERYQFEKDLMAISSAAGLDPLLVAALCVVESNGEPDAGVADHSYWGLMQTQRDRLLQLQSNFQSAPAADQCKSGLQLGCKMYNEKGSAIGTSNPVLVTMGYNAGEGLVLGCEGAETVPRLDENPAGIAAKLNWANKDKWLWTECVEALAYNVSHAFPNWSVEEKCQYFPKVCGAYIELSKKMKSSQYSNGQFGFPFAQQHMGGVYFTSPFGPRTIDVEGASSYHAGIDLAADAGTPIIAAAAGTVKYAISDSGGGNMVCIHHGNEIYTRYLHMERYVVSDGQIVQTGETIGYCGSTGYSSGPHLHFDYRVGGDDRDHAVDPVQIYPLLAGKVSKDVALA